MKTNKFFSAVFAALALVGFTACEPQPTPDEVVSVVLDQTTLTLEVGATATLVATVDPAGATVEWASQDPTVASVADGVVTGLAAGNTIIVASAGGKMASCIVKVNAAGTPGTGDNPGSGTAGALKGSQIWPIILDGDAYAANESKIVASFQPNDIDQFLYVWENTYTAGNGDGLNSLGNSGYTALITGNVGWSGLGFVLTDASANIPAMQELCAAIVANPDQYALHMAIKSTDEQSHTFYFLGTDKTKFVLGSQVFDGGTILADFPRDGSWHEFDVELAAYAPAIAESATPWTNFFVALSGGNSGKQLNLDAVYFYKK